MGKFAKPDYAENSQSKPACQVTPITFDLQSATMGEAKRKREAVLNGPCPCGSQKTARLCCFNGVGWHKPPAVLGLKALPATGRVEKCYMMELGSCVAPMSAEHIISAPSAAY